MLLSRSHVAFWDNQIRRTRRQAMTVASNVPPDSWLRQAPLLKLQANGSS
jgi:hypothetical protein